MATQRERIIEYMNTHGSITPMEAFTELGITKLATQISYMIRDGYTVEKIFEKSKNRYGEPCHYMRYRFKE